MKSRKRATCPADSMRVSFPTKEALLAAGSPRPEVVKELYDLWYAAHEEAMALAVRLPEVFGDPPRPAITLHVARGYDDEWILSHPRGLELRAKDPERHWYEVTAESTRCFQEYFTFSDSEGWRFYLPAFIRHYLADFPLGRWDAVKMACERREHFDLITQEQTEFIEEFLALCRTWES